MAIWSSFQRVINHCLLKNTATKPFINQNVKFSISSALKGGHGPRLMEIKPSSWQWHKFKDMLHFYIMVGAIPCTAIVLYCNLYIGPAQLTPIPEDYVPKHWEYYSHPITRFITRYIHNSPQQEYEKYMHYIYDSKEKAKLLALEKRIKKKMYENKDFQAYYYQPITAKYLRAYKEVADEVEARLGDNEP